ncbi:MAG: hypothetical protein M1834_006131 [Cirrosporium novae-zelandiae]|nr:MAG: hypothetical protein M1834_006131 [Cirrosporium novae-zelandiae]
MAFYATYEYESEFNNRQLSSRFSSSDTLVEMGRNTGVISKVLEKDESFMAKKMGKMRLNKRGKRYNYPSDCEESISSDDDDMLAIRGSKSLASSSLILDMLPPEVRLIIYEKVLNARDDGEEEADDTGSESVFAVYYDTGMIDTIVAHRAARLSAVCKAFHEELWTHYLRQTKFWFTPASLVRFLLKGLNPKNADLPRTMKIDLYPTTHQRGKLNLRVACACLKDPLNNTAFNDTHCQSCPKHNRSAAPPPLHPSLASYPPLSPQTLILNMSLTEHSDLEEILFVLNAFRGLFKNVETYNFNIKGHQHKHFKTVQQHVERMRLCTRKRGTPPAL